MGEQERNALAAVGPDGDNFESGGRERSMPSRRTFALSWTPAAGSGFVDNGNDTHVVRNEESVNLVTVVVSLVPAGDSFRGRA